MTQRSTTFLPCVVTQRQLSIAQVAVAGQDQTVPVQKIWSDFGSELFQKAHK